MMLSRNAKIISMLITSNFATGSAFVPFVRNSARPSTNLYIEDDIADMIDNELVRLQNIKQFKIEEFQRQKKQLLVTKSTPDEVLTGVSDYMSNDGDVPNQRQMFRDKRLAKEDPQRYCIDRCLSTGSCEVYEDFFDLSAADVVQFCNECVLSEEEEPCDIPEGAIEKYTNGESLRP